ncbi:MAG: FkbM family methyltransferase [Planctomycetota bacterium]
MKHLKAAWKRPLRQLYLRHRESRGKIDAQVKLLRQYKIDLVLDVGANRGQYAKRLLRKGFAGRVVSFEPLPDAFADLSRRCQEDPNWSAINVALGDQNARATLNIAGNSQSSSLHPMLDRHVESAPDSAYTGTVDVDVRRLDQMLDQIADPNDRIFMKIDVQGHEQQTLAGASGCFDRLCGLELELSLVSLYEGQELWQETIRSLNDRGFELSSLKPCFNDPETGVLLQADGVFVRPESVPQSRANVGPKRAA